MFLDSTFDIHIPVPYWNISQFRQSLGHKLNHSFRYNNTMFGYAYHPRFGNIRAIVATTKIQKGKEILVNYGYELGSQVPTWYSALYKTELGLEWYKFRKQPNQCQRHLLKQSAEKNQKSQ